MTPGGDPAALVDDAAVVGGHAATLGGHAAVPGNQAAFRMTTVQRVFGSRQPLLLDLDPLTSKEAAR